MLALDRSVGTRGERWTAVAGAIGLLISGVVMHEASEQRGPLALDRSILRFAVAHRAGWPATVARVVTHLGDPPVLVVAAVVAALLLARRAHGAMAVLPPAALVVGSVTEVGLKLVFRRPRPPVAVRLVPEAGFSLPSGHATASAALFVALALAVTATRGRRARIAALLVAGVATVAVAGSRVLLGVHWTSDVVAGVLLGSGVAFVLAAALHRWDRRRFTGA